MTVIDMTPEALFALVEPMRAAKQLRARQVLRCEKHKCFLLGTYEYAGTVVTIATRFRLSTGRAEALGLDQEQPGRAWLGAKPPDGTRYGCRHHLAQTQP